MAARTSKTDDSPTTWLGKLWDYITQPPMMATLNILMAVLLMWVMVRQLRVAQHRYLGTESTLMEALEGKHDQTDSVRIAAKMPSAPTTGAPEPKPESDYPTAEKNAAKLSGKPTAQPSLDERLNRLADQIEKLGNQRFERLEYQADAERKGVGFLDMLLMMLVAGALGGVLCNLRGLFEYVSAKKAFPEHLILPYYVRPFSAAICGFSVYFVANLIVVSVTVQPVANNVPFQGMVSFIGMAIIAGFGCQEFMERLKATVKTLFGQDNPGAAGVQGQNTSDVSQAPQADAANAQATDGNAQTDETKG